METMRHISGTRFNGLASLPLPGLLGALSLVAFIGCGQMQADDTSGMSSNVLSDNGLRSVNGLRKSNGFDPTSGVSMSASLSSAAGLSGTAGLMTTTEGRMVAA